MARPAVILAFEQTAEVRGVGRGGGGGQGRPFLQTSSAQLPPKGDAERIEHQMELCIELCRRHSYYLSMCLL